MTRTEERLRDAFGAAADAVEVRAGSAEWAAARARRRRTARFVTAGATAAAVVATLLVAGVLTAPVEPSRPTGPRERDERANPFADDPVTPVVVPVAPDEVLAVRASDGMIGTYDVRTRTWVHEVRRRTGPIEVADMSADHRWVAVAEEKPGDPRGCRSVVRTYLRNGAAFVGHGTYEVPGGVTHLALSADGQRLAYGSIGGGCGVFARMAVRDLETGAERTLRLLDAYGDLTDSWAHLVGWSAVAPRLLYFPQVVGNVLPEPFNTPAPRPVAYPLVVADAGDPDRIRVVRTVAGAVPVDEAAAEGAAGIVVVATRDGGSSASARPAPRYVLARLAPDGTETLLADLYGQADRVWADPSGRRVLVQGRVADPRSLGGWTTALYRWEEGTGLRDTGVRGLAVLAW